MVVRRAPAAPVGRGNATITDDGCPVEIYAALSPAGEAEIIHAAVAPGGSILELGCGTGRIAEPLAALGHRVVGVDSSAEMLTHLRTVQPVQSSVEELRLSQRFDGVVLASRFVNTYDPVQRQAILETARWHVASGGVVVLQRLPLDWADRVAATSWVDGPVELELFDVVRHGDGIVSATVRHRLGDLVAEQDFSSQVLDDDLLREALATADLSLGGRLTEDGSWVTATLCSESGPDYFA